MSDWIDVKERLPEEGQHVLVWTDRMNVFAFPRGCPGDDGTGRVRMGDAIFTTEISHIDGSKYNKWSGQGPCSFTDVTHWMHSPQPPKGHRK